MVVVDAKNYLLLEGNDGNDTVFSKKFDPP